MDNVTYQKEPIDPSELSPESKRRMILGLVESLKSNELVEVSEDISGKPFEVHPGIEWRKQYQLTKYELLFRDIHEFERIYKEVSSIVDPLDRQELFEHAIDSIKNSNYQNISYFFDIVSGPYKEKFEFRYEKKLIPEFEIDIKVKEDK